MRRHVWIWLLVTTACGAQFNAAPPGPEGGGGSAGAGAAGGGGAGSGAGPGGGAPSSVTACSFSDDFNDGSFDAPWSPYGDVVIDEGQVHMTLTPNAAEYHGLAVTNPIAVLECGIWLEVLDVGQTGESGDVYLQATRNGNTGVSIGVFGDRLTAWDEVNGAQVFTMDVPYDPVAHRWWMLREAGGKVLFETSPDGRNWTAFASQNTPDYFNAADVQVGGCTWNPVAEPGEIVFDNVNVRVP